MTTFSAELRAAEGTPSLSLSWGGAEARELYGFLLDLESAKDPRANRVDWGACEAVLSGKALMPVLRSIFGTWDEFPQPQPISFDEGPNDLRKHLLDGVESAPGSTYLAGQVPGQDIYPFIEPDGLYYIYADEF